MLGDFSGVPYLNIGSESDSLLQYSWLIAVTNLTGI